MSKMLVLTMIPSASGFNKPESDMIGARIRFALAPTSCNVARAILVCAKERTAPVHLLLYTRLARIEAVRRPLRIPRERSLRCQRLIVVMAIPVAGPFPDVAGHVVKAVTVGWKGRDWRGTLVAVFFRILVREVTLKRVGHELAG